MYAVINAKDIPMILLREGAEQSLAALRENNPDADWQLFIKVEKSEGTEALEQMYALASLLLNASGANPFELALQRPKLDGTTEEISAVQIMQQARHWIDRVTS